MISNSKLNKYADVLLWGLKTARSKKYKKNDNILIRFDLAGLKLAEILQGKILDMGMNPVLRLGNTPQMEKNFFEKANDSQLVFQLPGEKEFNNNLHGIINLLAPESITHLKHIDPQKIGKAALARKPLRDILWGREDMGHFGWTLCMIPTQGAADTAGISLKQYTSQVIRACYLDMDDPVKGWEETFSNALTIKKWINSLKVEYYHMESDNMDLKIYPGEKRKWIGVSGHNIPSFELFISPDWRRTEGIYYANLPSYKDGNYVEGVRFEFKKGEVVKSSAKKGEEFVKKQISMDKGARRVGEFSLTDRRFSKINKFMANTLFDENFGGKYGNCHLAVGMSYSDTYAGDPSKLTKQMKERLGFNDSALHWDLINTEDKAVTAILKSGQKKIIYERGMFLY
ncbi:MAG: aminopeptidase [Deltaproteobacteria bacterium]|nr:aminopeptidase [Deltaproteobacteria bacterium]